jgi:hypothetical protein
MFINSVHGLNYQRRQEVKFIQLLGPMRWLMADQGLPSQFVYRSSCFNISCSRWVYLAKLVLYALPWPFL